MTVPREADLMETEQSSTTKKVALSVLREFAHGVRNRSTTAQNSITAATLTYITGSALALPADPPLVGTRLRWLIVASKTNVGTAATAFHVRIGTNGTTGDTAILTFTLGVGTAAVDQFTVEIECVFRTVGAGTSAVLSGVLSVLKTAAATAGFIATPGAVVPVVSSGFNSTTAGLIAGVSVTTGSTVVISVQQVFAEHEA